MSTDILPKSSVPPSAAARLKLSQSSTSKAHELHAAAQPEEDPALLVGLVLTCARQGQGVVKIPSLLLARLHDMARSGDPTCRLVLECLNRRAGANHQAAVRQVMLPEIVSGYPAMKEDR